LTTRIDNVAQPINAPEIFSAGSIVELFRPENLAASQHPAIVSLTRDPVTDVSASIIAEVGGPTYRPAAQR
jgi:hypothetical protein